MGDFEQLLPDEIGDASVRSGEELVLTYAHARRAIDIATKYQVAVLGVECFRILADGLGVEVYSSYGFETDVWREFVERNNREAILFLDQNSRGDGYGYILTTASQNEFTHLKRSTSW